MMKDGGKYLSKDNYDFSFSFACWLVLDDADRIFFFVPDGKNMCTVLMAGSGSCVVRVMAPLELFIRCGWEAELII